MQPDDSPLLIVAISGRALAQSARRSGRRVIVFDCFGDADTRAAAEAVAVIARPGAIRIDRRRLLAALAQVPDVPVVYGSGFEGRVALLERIRRDRPVYGNPPEVVVAARDPQRFFALLDDLALPHPEISATTPPSVEGWLLKQSGSAGGVQVRLASGNGPRARSYFQRLHPGIPMSVLFLADGQRARVLGFNEQWTAPRPGRPFLYGGAVSRVELPAKVEEGVRAAVEQLTARLGLRGLNGIDFLRHDEQWSLLELNPRPTATVELYDADYADGLVEWHIRASKGDLPAQPEPGLSRAAMVIHAPGAWTIPDGFRFPLWCTDLPATGMAMREDDPVCTVHAEAEDPGVARALVLERQHHLERLVGDVLPG
jgi:predicted ATP-grasp superfamily ATP-dependent carboligase